MSSLLKLRAEVKGFLRKRGAFLAQLWHINRKEKEIPPGSGCFGPGISGDHGPKRGGTAGFTWKCSNPSRRRQATIPEMPPSQEFGGRHLRLFLRLFSHKNSFRFPVAAEQDGYLSLDAQTGGQDGGDVPGSP